MSVRARTALQPFSTVGRARLFAKRTGRWTAVPARPATVQARRQGLEARLALVGAASVCVGFSSCLCFCMFVVCNADKNCSLPTCTDEPCPASAPANGTRPYVPETASGYDIAVACATGYSTSENATCNFNNSWSLPTCTACDGENEYADVTGLVTCKACPAGSAGVTESGGAVAL